FDHGADLPVSIKELETSWIVRGEAGSKLAAILQVEQQSGHESRNFFGLHRRLKKRRRGRSVEMVNGGNAALVMELSHAQNNSEGFGLPKRRLISRFSLGVAPLL